MSDIPIDLQILTELQETTGHEFALELVTTFLDEAPGMIDEMKNAAAVRDADGFRRAAHSLKSNANIFGATGLAELSRKMEQLDITNANPNLAALEAEYTRAAAALRDAMDG